MPPIGAGAASGLNKKSTSKTPVVAGVLAAVLLVAGILAWALSGGEGGKSAPAKTVAASADRRGGTMKSPARHVSERTAKFTKKKKNEAESAPTSSRGSGKYRPGEEREFEIAPGVTMKFCWVPPGKFMMGSPVS
jgi:hypothetical protein